MERYYYQPQHYTNYSCTGGSCPFSCCDGWNVYWFPDEYEHLMSAEMTDVLRDKINGCLKKSESGLYKIELCENGRCPLHNNETGLCDIQKEIGSEYFGITCNQYPRRFFKLKNDVIIRGCSTSCPAIIRLLCNDEHASEYETVLAKDKKTLSKKEFVEDSFEQIKKSKYLKYRKEILDFYSNLFIGNSKTENTIVLGALAANKISNASEQGKEDSIPNILNEYSVQKHNPSIIQSIEKITPNFKVKFTIVNNLIYEFFGTKKGDIDISKLHDGENVILDRYNIGKENFMNIFCERKFAINNIVCNMFADIFVGINFTSHTFFDFYSYFTSCIAVLQVFAYTIGYESDNIESTFIRIASILNRAISHSFDRPEAVLSNIKQVGLTTPAHLALIIKG